MPPPSVLSAETPGPDGPDRDPGADGLRVGSWNVLADAYVRADWFPRSDPALLAPGARLAAVLELAAGLDVDVWAFQEADEALAVEARDRLVGFDVVWCLKGQDRPDGCLTAVRSPWVALDAARVVFDDADDGGQPSGHVALLVRVARAGARPGPVVTVANTHLRFAPEGTHVDAHVGVVQARQLVEVLAGEGVAVVAADTNDVPGGPVRAVLAAAGFVDVHGGEPTSLFAGAEPRALDVVVVRGASVVPVAVPVPVRCRARPARRTTSPSSRT